MPRAFGISKAEIQRWLTFERQADAVLAQVNPVSTTLYTVLDTTLNCEVLSINAYVTWGVTQPTPLEIIVTVDGQSMIYLCVNPISNTYYKARNEAGNDASNQVLETTAYEVSRDRLLWGRSIKIEARLTWAVTQPTLLHCRVKYNQRD